ncbi:MAG: class I SAM-dependent methyltransferase [Bacteroidales bacterium]|nr:class I SAM-dependent methyltransferase [Bacteroidales bacterium]MCF8404531.1 class I SAM-dependent methyltransferase [Bacteroidales bacterium]
MNKFVRKYEIGKTPWETNRVDKNLIRVVEAYHITPCKTLDVACGTGNSAIYFSQQGFDVVGVDISEIAISNAIQKNKDAGANCRFFVLDFLKEEIPEQPFDFVFDRGGFHSFRKNRQRMRFIKNTFSQLNEEGYWLSLIANKDGGNPEKGPLRLSAMQIVKEVEPWFEVIQIETGNFDSDNPNPARIWICLFKKRKRT